MFVPVHGLSKNLIFQAILALPIILSSVAFYSASAETKLPVMPATAAHLQPIELGQLVLLLMPDDKKPVDWDFRSEDPHLLWITSGIEKQDSTSVRKALARVHVNGNKSTILLTRKVEVAWVVTLMAELAKFGPRLISIKLDQCESHCRNISPLLSLARSGIKAAQVCHFQQYGDSTTVWRLTNLNKRPTLFVEEIYGGNAVSEWRYFIELQRDEKDLCAEHAFPKSSKTTTLSPYSKNTPVISDKLAVPSPPQNNNTGLSDEALKAKLLEPLIARLKDPGSVQFRSVKLNSLKTAVCGQFNSKNSFGGFGGFQRFIATGNKMMIEDKNAQGFQAKLSHVDFILANMDNICD